MKNTELTELITPRETITFPMDASLYDLLLPLRENWKIHNFYFVDRENRLQGVLTKCRILEFLAPLYGTVSGGQELFIEERLSRARGNKILQSPFPFLQAGHTLSEGLAIFVQYETNHLPLLDRKGHLLGEISADRLLKLLPSSEREHLYAV
ncbi:MAG: CBS domain-containing protein [Spirochaetales bacterium]|nr:CBS domain-containing protein [Spirochaetales bacterium]